MWFRKTESPEVEIAGAGEGGAGGEEGGEGGKSTLEHNKKPSVFKPPPERSKFEKFRRASFRRKSHTNQNGGEGGAGGSPAAVNKDKGSVPRKRSKSPHSVLRGSFETPVEEEEEEPSAKVLTATSTTTTTAEAADSPDSENKKQESTTRFNEDGVDVKENDKSSHDDHHKNETINKKNKNDGVQKDDDDVCDDKNVEHDDDKEGNDDGDEEDDDNDDDDNNHDDKDDDKDEGHSNVDDVDHHKTHKKTYSPSFLLSYNKTIEENPVPVNIFNSKRNKSKQSTDNSSVVPSPPSLLPVISDLPITSKSYCKKPSLKALKTDPPKRKFYKSFTSRRQMSRIDASTGDGVATQSGNGDDDDDALPTHSKEKILLTDPKFRNNRIEKSSSKTKISELEKRESIKRSRSGRKLSAAAAASLPAAFANAANEEVNKSKNLQKMMMKKKNSNNNNDKNSTINKSTDSGDVGLSDDAAVAAAPSTKFSRARTYSNLNLAALVKFVVSNKKLLNTNDFALMRRKSISEAASSIITVAATCKPLPIALKYTQDGAVAEAPTSEDDAKTAKNVVLVKKQKLKNSFCDRLNNNNTINSNINNNLNNTNNVNNNNNINNNNINNNNNNINNNNNVSNKKDNFNETDSFVRKKLILKSNINTNNNKVKRNSSNSSKSSGNFEDEAFYSCDEQDLVDKLRNSVNGPEAATTATDEVGHSTSTSISSAATPSPTESSASTTFKRKSSSPSLTSRVAAKINETTNNYKNRKAAAAANKTAAKKQRKSLAVAAAAAAASASASGTTNKRPEYYKQISVERLHSTSIVRQPSDRRPDTANASIRSNGNHSAAAASSQHNNSDLLHNSQASDASAGINSAADASVSSCGGSAVGGTSNAAGVGGADANAQDAADSSSRDSRKDRLQQQHQQNKSAPVSVNRSESYKERLSHKRSRNSRRKTSDPSLTSRPNDDQPDLGLSNSNYTASSNSSLSSGGGSESPSTSMEQVAAGAPGQHQQLQQQQQQPQQQQQQPQQQQLQQQYAAAGGHQHQHHHHHHHHHQHSHQDSFHGSSGSGSTPNNSSFWGGSIGGAGGPTIGQLARQWQFESDEEDDPLMEADWSSNVAADILAAFTDAEKKRQEIINEIYQTERNHVRTLKLLERLFFCPLQDSGVLSMDHLLLLFPPALVALRDLHGSFEQKLKQRRIEHNHVVNQVGDLLAGMFDGQSGDELCEYAAQFCARQQIALEALKEKRRKDETLQKILSKAESHKACRRLQLKDLLPTVLQRLTKYPLLFENLFKVTIRVVPDDVAEAEAIKRALESSKKILVDVNQAVKLAEDAHKLQNIQRKLDKSTFDKEEFKNLDLTQHRLIHDGSLTMKKNPGIQLHGLLFESMIVLLTKQDDKYSLKYLNATRISEVNNKPLSPIMNIDSETLVRQEAADKNSFFLIKTKTSQMLELRAPSSSECKTWFKHISDAAEQYKPRSKNASHEPVDDPAIATLPHSNTKESLEITPERPPPISATATMTTTPLAPMMMLPNNNSQHQQHHQQQQQQQHLHHQHSADLRNGREGTPTAEVGLPGSCSIFAHPGAVRNNRMNNNNSNEQALSVNRTMSTRSCGDSSSNNNNYSDRSNQLAQTATNGVILRHTQSARQAAAAAEDATSAQSGGSGSKRDSTSIIYSNNSNNTRTLMQSSPPLVEPTAIQISISPAHTAEPVLTPAEKLRRLDAAIRDGLLEKQKIICDMFRLPIEHFHEIVDIASLPEAPKDSADIALATYAQVQSLTEVVNEYMKVTPEQEISAVSTSVCDQCHEKQRKQQQHQHQQHSYSNTNGSNGNSNNNNSVFRTPLAPMSSHMPTSRSTSSALSAAAGASSAVQRARSPSPPPLPPPNKQQAQAQHKTATPSAKLQTHSIDAQIIHEDDDGYCEIDELRLPALPSMMPASMMVALLSKPAPAAAGAPPPLPPPAGTFKTPPPPPPPPATMKTTTQTTAAAAAVSGAAASAAEQTVLKSSSPELTKRQSTISAESIPEESADEVTQAMGDDGTGNDDDNDVPNKALLSSNPATSTATTAEAATSTETEKNEGEVDTALNKELKEGEISQPETTSSVGQTSSKQEQESPQKQEPGDGQKKDDVTEDREEDIPAQQSEEKEEQTQLEATAVAEITSNTLTSGTTTVTAAATENMTDHVVDNAEKENKNVVASAEPQNQNSAANVEEDDTALSSKPNVEINDASVETLDALNKLKTALIMVDSMSQTTLTGNVSGGAGIAVNTPSYCGPSRILHATSLEPSVPCHALNSIVTALNAQISLLLPKINERDMERERLRKENQHLRELLNAMHERQRVEAKIETPKDITKCADDDANDEIDAPSNSNNNNTNAINTNNNNKTNININSKALSTSDDAATDSAAAVEAAKSTAAAEK